MYIDRQEDCKKKVLSSNTWKDELKQFILKMAPRLEA